MSSHAQGDAEVDETTRATGLVTWAIRFVAAVFVDHITRWHNILGIVVFFLASFAYSYYTFTNKALSRSPSTVTKPADESTGLVKEKSNA